MLIEQLAEDLTAHFRRGFNKVNLWSVRAFYLAWPLEKILQALSGEFRSTDKKKKSAKHVPSFQRNKEIT